MYRDTSRRDPSSYDPHRREEQDRYRQPDTWSSRPPQTPNDQFRSFRFPERAPNLPLDVNPSNGPVPSSYYSSQSPRRTSNPIRDSFGRGGTSSTTRPYPESLNYPNQESNPGLASSRGDWKSYQSYRREEPPVYDKERWNQPRTSPEHATRAPYEPPRQQQERPDYSRTWSSPQGADNQWKSYTHNPSHTANLPPPPSPSQHSSYNRTSGAIYERPTSRDHYSNPAPLQRTSSDVYYTTTHERSSASRADFATYKRQPPTGPRAAELMSQFSTSHSSRIRQENENHSTYSTRDTFLPPSRDNEFDESASLRDRPSAIYSNPKYPRDADRYPTSAQWTRPPPSPPPPPRSPSRPITETISPRPLPPSLSIRDSINYNRYRHNGNGNPTGPKQDDNWSAHKYPTPGNRLADLQAIWRAGRAPLLSPKLRSTYHYTRTTGYRRSYDHTRRDHLHRTVQDTRQYPQSGRLEVDNTLVRLPTEKSGFSHPSAMGQPPVNSSHASSATSTPPSPSDDDDSVASSTEGEEASPPAPVWVGKSNSARDALVRIFANQSQSQQQKQVEKIVKQVIEKNRLIAKAQEPPKPEPSSKPLLRREVPRADEGQEKALRQKMKAEDDASKVKVKHLRANYLELHRRWVVFCKKLDEENPPEQPVPSLAVEQPLTGRPGRRNRGGLTDMVTSEYDMDQFLKKQIQSDRVDAELLGRLNAAKIPDMISITDVNANRFRYNDTNGQVFDAEEFYNYDHRDHWTEEEKRIFQEQMESGNRKKFGIIATTPGLHNRTPQDCVRHYYWEKTEEKYKILLGKKVKKRWHKRQGSAAGQGVGGLMGDIRAGDKKTDTPDAGDEQDEDDSSDSAYEQERQRRKPGRGRGRGRGRGGWRGGPRGGASGVGAANRDVSPQQVADVEMADQDMADPSSAITPLGLDSTPARPSILQPGGRKRKNRMDEGEEGDRDSAQPTEKKKPISSYWTVADRERMKDLVEEHGDDYDAISKVLSQKSAVQVKNYIKGKPELSEVLSKVVAEKKGGEERESLQLPHELFASRLPPPP